MDDHNLLWIFVDFHNALITTINEASSRWDLSKLMHALKDHKLRGLSLNCARTINDNREFLAKDKSKLMEAIKHETDAYALVSGQTTEFVEPEQLQYLFKSVAEMQIALLQFNADHIDR
ncbi:hypothetical protein [Lactobacillus kitasatonis]|nr:hypothetical protein [Lactobacillus kitasatonis]